MSPAVPKVVSVEVVASKPTDTDRTMIAQLSAETERPISDSAFIVKIRLDTIPPATGHGWALYVGETRIPKYWEYPGGIYFKVLDETFLSEHQGEPLRFSENGTEFVKSGAKLPGPGPVPPKVSRLPLQDDVLSESAPARAGRKRPAQKRVRRPAANATSKARRPKRKSR